MVTGRDLARQRRERQMAPPRRAEISELSAVALPPCSWQHLMRLTLFVFRAF